MENFFKELEGVGCDIKYTIERFSGNVDIYLKFLLRFPDDDNAEQFFVNYQKKDQEAAIFNVHALKGVSGNLGLTKIYNITEKILAELRSGNMKIDDEVAELSKLYNEIQVIINKYKANMTH